MDERIARLKSSNDARKLATNARRLGHPELEAQAMQRAHELRAIEEGYTSPAEQAIFIALYAYEEQRSRQKGSAFRANRTRPMLAKHGALVAAERMVLNPKPSKGFEVLEEAGLPELSFEAIIDRFPNEFLASAVEAARARLEGMSVTPMAVSAVSSSVRSVDETEDHDITSPAFDAEALTFLNGFQEPDAWTLASWMPRYRETTQRERGQV